MCKLLLLVVVFQVLWTYGAANDVLGCGGFIKSHVPIDFSKVTVKLYTKQKILKDQTTCAPNNGYYFIPLYDKGEYILQLQPPPGWSFTPTKVAIQVNGKTDLCSQGKDINFTFKGFGITGKVQSVGSTDGPPGIEVELKSNEDVRETVTAEHGTFFFTPVYPGSYVVTIKHPKWKLAKNTVSVTVTEGNTDLPANSLLVGGYDVIGGVKSDGEPIEGLNILLFSESDTKEVDGCDKSPLSGYTGSDQKLCHVVTDANGLFTFPSVPNGNYYVVPLYKGQSVHFKPNQIKFVVTHGSYIFEQEFEVVGFSVSGRVLTSENGRALGGANVFLNGVAVGVTRSDGSYTLERIKAGSYVISVEADHYRFQPKTLKVNPSVLNLPDLFPASYHMAGSIASDKSAPVTVFITRVGSTKHFVIKSDSSGSFSEYLSPGKYQVQVKVDQDDNNHVQFFPLTQTVEITNHPIFNVSFSQLKVSITGKVECLNDFDCKDIKVILTTLSESSLQLAESTIDGWYTFKDLRPGSYKIFLTTNKLCWKDAEFPVTAATAKLTVPTFVQSGYAVSFISSHDTKITYREPGQEKTTEISVVKGTSRICVQTPGAYDFLLDSCHVYPTNALLYNTNHETNEIVITAKKHRALIGISAGQNFGDLYVSVKIDGVKTMEGPLNYKNGKYNVELYLNPGEDASITPQSETLYFNPAVTSVTGEEDCVDFGIKFQARKGKVFKGRITPPLQGVQITVESNENDILIDMSDNDGFYKFPPLDDTKTYTVTGMKESYVMIGPDADGNFLAHKLAEIIVEVVDEADGTHLQGALLSLSGGESYRSNLQTNAEGKITFPSLSPSEYFLKPMMKEYSFEPAYKIIDVQVGVSVKVQLKGKRVAYSAYGVITSLNGQPEEKMLVVATGVGNCSEYSEEATSESNGVFRIRGLLPYCSYSLSTKGSLDEMDIIERTVPPTIKLNSIAKDVTDLHLIVFRPTANTDVLVRVYTENPEHYKLLRLKVFRETVPSTVIQTIKVDTSNYRISADYNAGILIQIPPIPLDGKTYSVQLESTVAALNKAKPEIAFFTTETSFKYVQLDFAVKTNVTDQHIQQTSVWTLAFVFGTMTMAYNIDKLVSFVKFRVPAANFYAIWKPKPAPTEYVPVDNNDIDQIVESINAPKRKVKPKRI